MVAILKRPDGESKGIIVFSDMERPFLSCPAKAQQRALAALHDEYVFLMDWSWSSFDVPPVPWIDAHMAVPSLATFQDPDTRCIPISSRDFTPEHFRPLPVEKQWDILTIARPVRFKHLPDLLQVLRILFDRGLQPRTLLVCPTPPKKGNTFDPNFYPALKRLFSEEERALITLVNPTYGKDLFPLPDEVFPFFYSSSRVFTLFSKKEGNARVIGEALMSGVPVVARRTLIGGGLDPLDDSNSILFDDLDEAADAFTAILKGEVNPVPDVPAIRGRIGEEATTRRFVTAVQELFAELGVPWKGDMATDNLGRRLTSHVVDLPPRLRLSHTNHLRSLQASHRFARELLGEKPAVAALIGLAGRDAMRRIRAAMVTAAHRAYDASPAFVQGAVRVALARGR